MEIGCGDQPLAVGIGQKSEVESVVAIDFAPSIIEELSKGIDGSNACGDRNEVTTKVAYMRMDARELSFKSESFDIVVDKGEWGEGLV